MHLSSTIYQRSLCGKDENKAILSAHRYSHTLPGRCSKPVDNSILNHKQQTKKQYPGPG